MCINETGSEFVCFGFWRTMTKVKKFFLFSRKSKPEMEVGNLDDGTSYMKALEAALDMTSFNAYAQKVLNGPVVCSSSSSNSSSSSDDSDSDDDSDDEDTGKCFN